MVAAENHIELIGQEMLRWRENERVLQQHHESIERLEINIGELSETLVKQIQAGLDRVVKDAQRIEAESNKKIDALRDELYGYKIEELRAKQISDTSQLFNLNKLLTERVDRGFGGFDELGKDHQNLKDLHLALDADTKRITDKIRKNAQNLRADFDDHKDETKENFNHVHQSHKHHEEMIRNTNHRQDTMAEHLKLVLVNSRTTRAKMESVFEVHETQVAKFTRMEKDYDELNTSFKQMGREIGAMFDEMEDAKKAKELERMAGQKLDTTDKSDKRASFNEQSMAFNKAQEQAAERKKKKTEEASGVSMIAKAISDLAKQVQQSDSDISDLKDGIYTANNNINENVKRVGKYERFVTTVEIQVEQQAVQMTDVLATSQDMFSTINKNGKILNDTSRN